MNLRKIFKPLTLISYADMATLLSASLGFLAITYMIDGSEKSFIVAMLILPFCAIIDGMDGALARKFGTKHHYGKYLDSISDSIRDLNKRTSVPEREVSTEEIVPEISLG